MKLRSLLRHQSHSKLYRLTGSFLLLLFSAHTTALSLDDAIASQRALLSPYQHQIESRLETYQPLLAHIFNQLDHKKLPQQLALLPMLESSFDPNAISHAGSRGLWQLMPATAQRYGLQTAPNDQRLDVFASTDAALNYLAFLHRKFGGDLALTLAAYNAGEGRVARAIQRAGSREFHRLSLPQETRQYVQRFYALTQLIDVTALNHSSFQPMMLFSSQPAITRQALINLQPLPPLVKL